MFAIVCWVFSCKTAVVKRSIGEQKNAEMIKSVQVKPDLNCSDTGAAYNIDSLSLKGKVLSVFVNYSGGCKVHVFNAYSTKLYSKSMPPQLTICLKHDTTDDNCRKLVMQELKFDISSVLIDSYNEIVINVGQNKIIYKK